MKRKKFISMITVVMLILQLLSVAVPASAEEPTGYQSRQLMIIGNKIVYQDDSSTMVRLIGTNVPSLGWSKYGYGEHIIESLVESYDSWNSNLVRLPVSPGMWFDETIDSGQTLSRSQIYKNNINDMVRGAAARGKYLLLDCHTYVMPTQQVYDFWMSACDVYGNNPTVLFGLCNEPHDIKGQDEDAIKSEWQLWRNGGKILYNSAVTQGIGHQQLVEAIRDKGAKNILVAGGLGWGNNLKGIVGQSGDGVNYALIDQGSNGDTTKTGYGIMYDSHIYPSKGLEPDWDASTGCVRKFAPLLIGEFGWDSKDPNISNDTSVFNLWMPQILDWIDDVNNKYGMPANWTAWNLHMTSSPRAITGWDFNPTTFLGKYVKERLLSYPSNTYPVTGSYINNFAPDQFREYATNVTKNSSMTHSVTNGTLKFTYNRISTATAAEKRMAFPVDWVFDGVQTIEFNMQGNSAAVTTGTILEIGFEGTDQELWTKQIKVQDVNDNKIVIPVNELRKLIMNARGDDILSNGIRSFYFGVANTSNGTLTLHDFKITKSANPTISKPAKPVRTPNHPNYLFDMESPLTMMTVSKNDNGPGSGQGDYFKSEILAGEGMNGGTGIKVSYDRRMGVWGGFSDIKMPAGTSCADAKYVSFCVRGDGQYQTLSVNPDGVSTGITLAQGDTSWHQYTYKLDETGCELPESITTVSLFANTKMAGVYWVDNIQITDVKPIIIIKADPVVFENGFEDTQLTCKMLNGSTGNAVTGKIVDGGYNSQCAYQLDYQQTADGTRATAEIDHPSWNLTNTSIFTFDAKSASGSPESITVGLLDKVGIASKINRTFELTNQWQRFALPIEDFMLNDRSILSTRIKGVHINNNNAGNTTRVLIDNISFSNEVVEPPVANAVNYKNTFDPDVYEQNGGIYTNVGDNGTDFIRATKKWGEGYNGTAGLAFQLGGTCTGRQVSIKGGFPAAWDFSKAKYASVMLKGTNSDTDYVQNMNKVVVELWNDYTDASGNAKSVKTGTINLDATAKVWSNLIVPIEPNTKDNPSLDLVKGTNKLVIYSTLSQNGGFIIDDLSFNDMKPEEVIPPQPAEFKESFDKNTVFNLAGGYYNSASDYVFKKDGGRQHWGRQLQWIRPADTVPSDSSKSIFISSALPLSWRISRTTHFIMDAKLLQPNEWVSTDFSTSYGTLSAAVSTATVPIALVDSGGNEFIQKVTITNNSAWLTYRLPLTDFVNKDGKPLVLSTITSVRIYPDEAGGQAGLKMDNMGFKTIGPVYNVSVSGISVMKDGQDLKTNGLSAGVATVTANFTGLGKDVSLFAAVYKKSNGTLDSANMFSKDISADGNTSSLITDIVIPENPQDYILRIFVWDRTYNALCPISGGYLEIQ